MKQDSPSQTALLISKVMYLNSRQAPEYVVPATKEISEKHVQDENSSGLLRILLNSSLGRKVLSWVQNTVLPGFTAHVQRRKWWIYDYTQKWSQKNPQGQLVIIGAGLDGLALEMSRRGSFQKVIEVDHPATQKAKTELVNNSKIDFVPLDLTTKSVKDLKALLVTGAPTLVVWEGVSMYLVEKDVQKFLQDLAETLSAKSELVWTYMVPDHESKIRFHYGAGLISWVLNIVKEPFVWGVPAEKLGEFVKPCGWTLQKDIGTYEVPIPVSNPCRGEKISVISVVKN
ncbi:class I SAM-dependent methyltransferase [Bdellovibrio sp. HCB337]|uniref:class I SAM-dependent methyltransferase n=1 Tax=Bdellovibrio sp. HCB337 TaxID=3394358 RepID=UPI0039A480F9